MEPDNGFFTPEDPLPQAEDAKHPFWSSAEDDPVFGGPAGEVAPLDGDSIFSVSSTPLRPVPKPAPRPVPRPEPVAPEPSASAPSAPAPVAAAPEESTPEEPTAQESQTPPFDPSAIDDPVLQTLFEEGMLSPAHFEALGTHRSTVPAGKQWRLVLAMDDVPAEAVLAAAARVHNLPTADLETPTPFLKASPYVLPADFRAQCAKLKVVPYACTRDASAGTFQLALATSDPLRFEVEAFCESLELDTRLHYAPAAHVEPLVQTLAA